MTKTYETEIGKLTYSVDNDELDVSVVLPRYSTVLGIKETITENPIEKMLYALKCATMHLAYCVMPGITEAKRNVGAYIDRERINITIDTPNECYVKANQELNAFLHDAVSALA